MAMSLSDIDLRARLRIQEVMAMTTRDIIIAISKPDDKWIKELSLELLKFTSCIGRSESADVLKAQIQNNFEILNKADGYLADRLEELSHNPVQYRDLKTYPPTQFITSEARAALIDAMNFMFPNYVFNENANAFEHRKDATEDKPELMQRVEKLLDLKTELGPTELLKYTIDAHYIFWFVNTRVEDFEWPKWRDVDRPILKIYDTVSIIIGETQKSFMFNRPDEDAQTLQCQFLAKCNRAGLAHLFAEYGDDAQKTADITPGKR